jgi:hypothetical protein
MGITSAILLAILFGGPLYFAPSIVAVLRKKKNLAGVIILNTAGGWTVIGWALAMLLAWAGP